MSSEKKISPKEMTISQEEKTAQSSIGPSASPHPVTVLSTIDSAISDLVKEQRSLEELNNMEVTTVHMIDLLALPEECEPLQGNTYRFKWLSKDKNLPAKLRSGVWVLCNSKNAPFLKNYRFGAHGAVEQAGMLLAFTPERLARIREQIPAKRSADLIKHYTKDLPKSGSKEKGGFYQPETSSEDDDNEEDNDQK